MSTEIPSPPATAPRQNTLPLAIGVILALAALTAIAGWVLQIPEIAGLPLGDRMAFNTALGFLLAALALLSGTLAARPRANAQTGLGAIIAVLFGLILAQHLSGVSLGIDWPELHTWLPDSNPAPGRSSVITCAGFILFSAALIVAQRTHGRASVFAVHTLTAAVAALGVLAIVGELLDFDAIFDITLFGQVSPSAALGFIFLGVALWLAWRSGPWSNTYLLRTDDARITFAGALIVTVIAAIAGISGMAILQASAEHALSSGLAANHRNRSSIFELMVADHSRSIESIARRINIVRLHSELMSEPGNEANIAFLHSAAQSWIGEGLSFLEFRDRRAQRIASDGRAAAAGGFEARLPGRAARSLLWDRGLVLRVEAPIRDGDTTVGFVIGEQPLPDLARAAFRIDEFGASGEVAVCAAFDRKRMTCLPTRFSPRPFILERSLRGAVLPMSFALDGQQGMIRTRDYRNRDVVAAYGPIGDLGLGMVVKVDAAELYAPVRERLAVALPLLLLLLGAGTWLLHAQVRPLARRLVSSERHLLETTVLQRAILDSASAIIVATDIATSIRTINAAGQRLLGYSAVELVGKANPTVFFDPAEIAARARRLSSEMGVEIEPGFEVFVARGLDLSHEDEWSCVRKDGSRFPAALAVTTLRADDGELEGFLFVATDISERKRVEQALRESEERLKLALDGSHLALWDWDVKSGKIYVSEQWNSIRGGAPESSLTTLAELEKLVHADDLPQLREHLYGILKGNARKYDIEHRVMTYSGEWKWIHSQGKVIARDADGRALRLTGTNADVDRRKQAELLLEHQAGHDALTGLPNRKLFHDRLARAMARSLRHKTLMAVMYLDIDKFKSINDSLGHDVGDALLKAFARRLTECVRTTDTLARLGGDEFTVILEEVNGRDDGRQIAEKIVAAMRPEFTLEHRRLNITTSVGVAFHDGGKSLTADLLVKKADEALYAAKGAGRNAYRVAE